MKPWSVTFLLVGLAGSALALDGCGSGAKDPKEPGPGAHNICPAGHAVNCEDAALLDLNLQATVAPGLVQNQADGSGWLSIVDATAGGFNASPPHAYVYAKFTDTGLEKVSIDDEASLSSMDWDIAFRRYVVRVNSGNSGPSCVGAVKLPQGTDFASVTNAPVGAAYVNDDIFDTTCTVIDDGSGLPGSPATALASFWQYTGCVQMTHSAFVAQLSSGRHAKLIFDAYYLESVQAQCDSSGSISASNTGSGTLRLRWAFVD